MNTGRWTPDQDAALLRADSAGARLADVAATLGRPVESVKYRRRVLGITSIQCEAWTEGEDECLKRLTEAGEAVADCASVLGRTVAAVNLRRAKLGICTPRERDWTDQDEHVLRQMTAAGRSILDCSLALGRSEHAISTRRRRLGICGQARQVGLAPRSRRLEGFALALREGALADGQTARFCRRIGVSEACFRGWLEGADPDLPPVIRVSLRSGVKIDSMVSGAWAVTSPPEPRAIIIRSNWGAAARRAIDTGERLTDGKVAAKLAEITGRAEVSCLRWLSGTFEPSLSSAVAVAKYARKPIDSLLTPTWRRLGET